VEHHVDLAGENDRIVETAGAMHQRMLHRNAARRRIGDAFLQQFILASVAASSGRNSTTRNLVPLSGGAMPISRPEGSAFKRLGGEGLGDPKIGAVMPGAAWFRGLLVWYNAARVVRSS